MMRTLVIGDIHGCLTALNALLEALAIHADDQVITLGDYVDRGPDSRGVLDRLLQLREQCQLVALRGNHDLMMLDARSNEETAEDWLYFGGQATLQSYALDGAPGKLSDVPQRHWDFLEKDCLLWYEIPGYFFVHGNVQHDVPLNQQSEYTLLWEKLFDPVPHFSGKVMVCGHTAQKGGLPLDLGFVICLDTFVYASGWLSALEIPSKRILQANQQGEIRELPR